MSRGSRIETKHALQRLRKWVRVAQAQPEFSFDRLIAITAHEELRFKDLELLITKAHSARELIFELLEWLEHDQGVELSADKSTLSTKFVQHLSGTD